MTAHIESTKENIAKLVLMPGDPLRAKYIAENFLTDYIQVNSIRGMIAYTGYYKNKKITIFPSGMGIPSMGIYSYELFKFYDVEAIIRIGSMGAYDKNLKLNDIVLVEESITNSSYNKELINEDGKKVRPSYELNKLIISTSQNLNTNLKVGKIYCSECFYNQYNEYEDTVGVEMESSALFFNAKYLGKKSACLLTVSDLVFDKSVYLTPKEREQNLNAMIILALNTLINYK